MPSTMKARTISNRLAEVLKVRLPALVLTESVGASGDPLITLNDGTAATTEANAVIRTVPMGAPLAKDIVGNTQQHYAQHVIQLATEANTSAGAAADNMTRAQLSAILGECIQMGCNVEWYEEAIGTVPVEGTITSSKLKATYHSNPYWPLSAQ